MARLFTCPECGKQMRRWRELAGAHCPCHFRKYRIPYLLILALGVAIWLWTGRVWIGALSILPPYIAVRLHSEFT